MNKTIEHQSSQQEHFDLKQIVRAEEERIYRASQVSLESDHAIYLRTFGVDPCLKLEEPDPNKFRKMK